MTDHKGIVLQLQDHVEQLREQLSGYEELKAQYTQAQRALAVFTQNGAPKSKNADKIFLAVQTRPDGISSAELADVTGIPQTSIGYPMQKLIEQGRVERRGSMRDSLYFPVNGEIPEAEETLAANQPISKELVLDIISRLGSPSYPEVMAAVHESVGGELNTHLKQRVYVILSKAQKAGLVKKTKKNDVTYVSCVLKKK